MLPTGHVYLRLVPDLENRAYKTSVIGLNAAAASAIEDVVLGLGVADSNAGASASAADRMQHEEGVNGFHMNAMSKLENIAWR